jgi:peptidoglycan/LPS O-acetylase OafA/YrhL
LGIIYSQHRQWFNGLLQRIWPVLAALALILYVLAVLNEAAFLVFPLAEVLLPLPLILLMPLMRREWIPSAQKLERVGKRSYGLYLTNLIIIYLVLFILQAAAPGLLGIYLLVVPLLFLAALFIPTLLMNATDRVTGPNASRYVFG